MNISKRGLNKIIQEEINEIFGFGKKAVKEYPASELATLVKGIDDASRLSGADLTRSQRTAIVKELTDVLEGQGFVVKENDRLITGEDDVIVTHQNAPELKVLLDSIAQLNPKMFKRLVKLFNRSALDISKLVKNIIPPITTVATVDDDSGADDDDSGADDEQPTEITPEDVALGGETLKQKMFGMFSFDKENLDNVDLLLTAGGIIPGGIGCIIGAVNAVFNFSRGEWLWGAFDTVFAVPPICGSGAGEVATGAKGIFKALGKVAAKLGGKSPKLLTKVSKTGKALGKAEKVALKEYHKVVKTTEKWLAKVIGEEAAAKHTAKYLEKLLGAIEGKKTKEQVAAVVALLPDSFFESWDDVLNKPVKDIWGIETLAKMDDLVGEEYEKLPDDSQVDMILFLANKAGILSDENYPKMKKTIAEIRDSAHEGWGMTKEQRIEKFIGGSVERAKDADQRSDFLRRRRRNSAAASAMALREEPTLNEQLETMRWKVLSGIK